MPFFKYLLAAFLFLMVAVLVGVLFTRQSARRWSSPVPWIFGVLLIPLGIFVVDEVRWEALEWNPAIPDDAAIVGVWQDRGCRIVLGADHTFNERIGSQNDDGTWTRDDFKLQLHGKHRSGFMRFVQMFGRYRLMINPPEDPDDWDGDAGLTRVQN